MILPIKQSKNKNMRKYYQVALAVIAVISLVSLLIYRHEYNKLRYVLEVFDYFGKPENKVPEKKCTLNDILEANSNGDEGFDEPMYAWQRLANNLHIYSAYIINDGEVHVIGIGETNGILDMQCIVLFEDELEGLAGHVRNIPIRASQIHERFDTKTPYMGYRFICSYTAYKRPVSIKLSTSEAMSRNITIPVKSHEPAQVEKSRTAICVAPPSQRPMLHLDMLAFLSFHLLLKVEHFLVYDHGTSTIFQERARTLVRSNRDDDVSRTYSSLPWNFPFIDLPSDVIRDIIETDCMYRTYNRVSTVVVLAWEEYFVPRHHRRLDDMVSHVGKSELLSADVYRLHTRTYCTEVDEDSAHPTPIYTAFRKHRYHPQMNQSRAILIRNPELLLKQPKTVSIREFPQNLACVGRYVFCNLDTTDKFQYTYDAVIWKFCSAMPYLNTTREAFRYEH